MRPANIYGGEQTGFDIGRLRALIREVGPACLRCDTIIVPFVSPASLELQAMFYDARQRGIYIDTVGIIKQAQEDLMCGFAGASENEKGQRKEGSRYKTPPPKTCNTDRAPPVHPRKRYGRREDCHY